ncbi:MAG: glycosyltransferase family 39 protein [Bryobacteraceae bacterium]
MFSVGSILKVCEVPLNRKNIPFVHECHARASVAGRAYSGDLAGEDEAAHYVTGLMVRTYLVSGQWLQPMQFARAYYEAYPKVALGHWPPAFYLIQALWTLIFSAWRESILLLMAVLAASCATLVQRLFSPLIGSVAATAAGLLFLGVPIVRYLSSTVMAELLVLAWTLLALTAYAKYLETERARDSLLFGVFAAMAILTKVNGLALALVPPISILLARKTRLLRRFSFWAPLALVAVSCTPWYLFTLQTAKEGWQGSTSPKFLLATVTLFNLGVIQQQVGTIILALAVLGCYAAVVRFVVMRRATEPRWAVAAATLVATLVFHSLIAPVRDPRHLLPAILMTIFLRPKGSCGIR